MDEVLEYLGDDSQNRAQAKQKIKHLRKVTAHFEWFDDEGDRFSKLLDEAEPIFDKRGQYIHNRYIGCSDGAIFMKPGRPDREQEKVTSGTLYEFANEVFDMSGSFNASKKWLGRAKKAIEQS
mgnify:FL=1